MGQYICHKTKKINLLQKQTVPFVFNEDKVTQNLSYKKKIIAYKYQISLYQDQNFRLKVNNQETPKIFNDLLKKI